MNILLFTLEYPPFYGGVSKYYENLVKYWPEQDRIFVLHNNKNRLISNKIYPKWLSSLFTLYVEVKKQNIDHILVGHILPLGTAAYCISKITGLNYSIFLHGMDFTLAISKPRKRKIVERILRGADHIICSNSYVAKLAEEFLGENIKNKFTVVNPGIDDNKRRMTDDRRQSLLKKYNLQEKIILLTVGRLVKRKGVDMVLNSLPLALKEIPNLFYAIVGRGEEHKNYQKKINNNKLQNNSIIITDADNDERNAWFDLSDVFIMPSRVIGNDFEGFGIVYLEANQYGKPVIAGDSGGVRDAVINNCNGLLVDPEDENAIINSIVKLAKDNKLREKLGERGRVRAEKEFNWRKQAKLLFEIIHNSQPITSICREL